MEITSDHPTNRIIQSTRDRERTSPQRNNSEFVTDMNRPGKSGDSKP
jgi:hypothetical protein